MAVNVNILSSRSKANCSCISLSVIYHWIKWKNVFMDMWSFMLEFNANLCLTNNLIAVSMDATNKALQAGVIKGYNSVWNDAENRVFGYESYSQRASGDGYSFCNGYLGD